MSFIQQVNRLNRIDLLIRRKATGSPKELANLLEVSPRTITNSINILRDLGADIYFCHSSKSYVYSARFSFKLGYDSTN
ncbi:HTH domain-containing protein [Persicobacter psychrovividus]|uniref:Helix-turn-helix type 11 domain-containing protein n=1 Tax=Persicobacter psychrovividus TaxID=387638 RepID=A0ABM7VMZ5_9BACT|nr:hypothetical protein PEPS_46480 [Persicobacter psychrovividus]